ncbi:MAG: VgrG-related protein [Actinomycetota bacterium]
MSNTERPTIKVDGIEIAEDRYEILTSVVVEQSVHVPDMFTIVFYDPDFELFDEDAFTIGSEIEIAFADSDEEKTITQSEVTAIAVQPAPSGRHELVVSGLGRGRRLASGSKIKIFEEVTDSDIAREIAGEYGLTPDVDTASTTYPWVIQTTDDYSFLSERARLSGFQWWVEDETLYFKKKIKDGSSPKRTWPDDLFSFKVRFSAAEAVGDVTVRGWDPETQQSFTGTSSVTAGADELGTTASAATAANTAMATFEAEPMTGLAPVGSSVEADALADSIKQLRIAEEVEARGISLGDPSIVAGTEVEIDGMGEKLSGNYLLTSVDHVFNAGDRYITRFRSGGRQPASLVDMLGGSSGTQLAASGDAGLGARVISGVVISVEDPDAQGRVQVNFPALGDDVSSSWARLCAPGAGEERGFQIVPEVGDEVLVAFENGNPRMPIVLGGVWSKKLKAPWAQAEAVEGGSVTKKGYTSRVGHTLLFEDGDSPDAKAVAVDLSDGATRFRLGEDAVDLDAAKAITITGQEDITIKTDTSGVTIEGSSITIKATGDLSLEGANVNIKGTAGVTVQGAKTDVKADGMLNVQAGGIAAVKGSMVQLG